MSCTNSQIHDLLIQLQQDNDEAAEQLYNCIANVLLSSVLKRGGLSYEDARESVQQTIFRIFDGGIKTYNEDQGGSWKWIRTIHGNIVIDKLRKMRRQNEKERRLDDITEETFASEEVNPELQMIEEEYNKEIYEAAVYTLENISEKEREAIFKGRGRGWGRREWHEAVKQARIVFKDYYRPTQ